MSDIAAFNAMGADMLKLAGALQDSLDAAGIHDADPAELADRIKELRFLGNTYVYRGEYPRGGGEDDHVVERAPGGTRLPRPNEFRLESFAS